MTQTALAMINAKHQYFCLCWTGDGEPLYSRLGELCEQYQREMGDLQISSYGKYRLYNGEAFELPNSVKEWAGLDEVEYAKLKKESYSLP